MAYNLLSGTVIASQKYLPGDLIVENLVSGSFKGDGTNIENVPRVSNAADNSLITNVGGNANTLTCESNLTFNGSTLSITGHLTASLGVSASYLFGDGSNLHGVSKASGSSRVYTTTGVETAGYLKVSGSSYLSGGMAYNRRTFTAVATASTGDYYLGLDSTGGAFALKLVDAASLTNGQTIVLKDEGGASNTNNITIFASGSQTIDGQNSVVLESPYASITLYCNGISKYFIC
jgi:hypothetical protein